MIEEKTVCAYGCRDEMKKQGSDSDHRQNTLKNIGIQQ